MRFILNGPRVLRALGAGALLAAGCGTPPQPDPSEPVMGLYSLIIDSQVSGAPSESQLTAMAPYLSRELHELLQGASARRNREVENFPDEEPSYADGSLFTSLFEGPSSLAILAAPDGPGSRRLAVRFRYDRAPPPISWTDTVVVTEEDGRLVVADVIYGGDWDFANRGTLLDMLRTTLAPGPETAWILRLDGIGAVRVGMTIAEVERLLQGTARIERIEPADECGYAFLSSVPAGISFMVSGDTVVRVQVDTVGFLTDASIGIGSTEAGTLARYGGLIRVEPHPYTGPEGHYLIVDDPARPGFRMIFETDGAVVIGMRAGRLPEADLIEGCA